MRKAKFAKDHQEYIRGRPDFLYGAPMMSGQLNFLILLVLSAVAGLVEAAQRSWSASSSFDFGLLSWAAGLSLAAWCAYMTLFVVGSQVVAVRYHLRHRSEAAPVWTLYHEEFKGRKRLSKRLTAAQLEVADLLLKEGFEGSVGELMTAARELGEDPVGD